MCRVPFTETSQPLKDFDLNCDGQPSANHIPGSPNIHLKNTSQVFEFISKDLIAQELEAMSPRLWMMTTPSSANINAIHRQRVKGRDIIITEESRLHLVWIHNRIFIKPLPRYLVSYSFWQLFLGNKTNHPDIRKAALGFLRTYRHLIKSEYDFRIARENHHLIPQDTDWTTFSRFLSDLESIDDTEVSSRYLYGEIRLTRLNFYAPFMLRRFYYEQVHGQYADYFGRLYGPILFVFAIVSTALNSMQVQLAAEQVSTEAEWGALWTFFSVFSMLCLVGSALISVCFVCLWLWIFLDEWIWTLKQRRRMRRRALEGAKC